MDKPLTKSEARDLPRMEFAEARRAYLPIIFAFVSRRVRPVEAAEDVVADVFLDAYRHWRRCKGPARLWLLGIARRKVADAYRKRKAEWAIRPEEGPVSDSMEEFVTGFEAHRALAILASLPPDERDCLSLQIVEELSIEEIATVIGRSHAAKNSLLQRARTRVRQLVNAEENAS